MPKKQSIFAKPVSSIFNKATFYTRQIFHDTSLRFTDLVIYLYKVKEQSQDIIETNLKVAEQHLQNNNIFDAKLRYKIVLKMDKNNFDALYGLGFIAFKKGDYDNALHYFDLSKQNAANLANDIEAQNAIDEVQNLINKRLR